MGRINNTLKYPFDVDVILTDFLIGTNTNQGTGQNKTKNYMILDIFRALQAYMGLTYMTLNDIASATYYYYGGVYGTDGDWVVFRWNKTDLNDKTQATFGFNMTYNDLASAWAARESLTYN